MKQDVISATELSRQLAKSIDRVRLTGRDCLILRGRRTVAKLAPPPVIAVPATDFASALADFPELRDERSAMCDDLSRIRLYSQQGVV